MSTHSGNYACCPGCEAEALGHLIDTMTANVGSLRDPTEMRLAYNAILMAEERLNVLEARQMQTNILRHGEV